MSQGPFNLSADEAVAVGETATAVAGALPRGREGPYLELAKAAPSGSLAAGLIPTLERVCVLALETGKARHLGKAETERLLTTVYRRTPGGQALAAEAAEVNRMLAQLAGRALQAARISCRMPGRYQLDLVVDGIEITMSIEPQGVAIRRVAAG